MSLLTEMVAAARLGADVLGAKAASAMRGFLLEQQLDTGAFRNRAGRADLYYTAFALQALAALRDGDRRRESPERFADRVSMFLRSSAAGGELDLVHLSCLARGWALVSSLDSALECALEAKREILGKIEDHRSANGGYSPQSGASTGTAYGAFLALGAYEDLGAALPDPAALVKSVRNLETGSGAWTNQAMPTQGRGQSSSGVTNATCAAVCVLINLGAQPPTSAAQWLVTRAYPAGGFTAAPGAPMPDLLSTATTLHALAKMRVPVSGMREKCLDFLDSLWSRRGGFYGYWGDDCLDCEYAFYGLLAAGHLANTAE